MHTSQGLSVKGRRLPYMLAYSLKQVLAGASLRSIEFDRKRTYFISRAPHTTVTYRYIRAIPRGRACGTRAVASCF